MINTIIHSNKTSWGNVWHIITDDGKGHIAASIENENEDTIFLYGLSVIPEVRNHGIGKALICFAENLGIQYNKTRCRLNVEKPKSWLYDFYIKLGYEYWDEDDEYYYLVKYL